MRSSGWRTRDGDLELIRASFAPDATWVYPGDLPLSGTWRGRDAIVDDFLGQLGVLLEPGAPLTIELTSTLSAGDQVVAEWTSHVTARGGIGFTNHNIAVFTVRNNKITSVREYTDTQQAARMFGLEYSPAGSAENRQMGRRLVVDGLVGGGPEVDEDRQAG